MVPRAIAVCALLMKAMLSRVQLTKTGAWFMVQCSGRKECSGLKIRQTGYSSMILSIFSVAFLDQWRAFHQAPEMHTAATSADTILPHQIVILLNYAISTSISNKPKVIEDPFNR